MKKLHFLSQTFPLLCALSLVMCAGGCKKEKNADDIYVKASQAPAAVRKSSEEVKRPEHKEALNPEYKKIAQVLASLSDRSREAIPNGNPEEFLDDLYRVLSWDVSHHGNDLSLYYLIDKKHTVGSDYVPEGLIKVQGNELWNVSRNDLSLRPEAYHALEELSKAALKDGIKLMVSSTYRSYEYQTGLFNRYVARDGLAEAERYSARPGTSQHQLGCAVDFGSIDDSWGETEMGKWVYQNAAKYGWSLSFPQGYEDVTGYMWECWHFRYIGKEACDFQQKWFGGVQQFMLEFIDAWKRQQ